MERSNAIGACKEKCIDHSNLLDHRILSTDIVIPVILLPKAKGTTHKIVNDTFCGSANFVEFGSDDSWISITSFCDHLPGYH